MSSISGISGGVHSAIANTAASKNLGAAAAKPAVRDSDGDFDGTAVGQIDAKDFGKGVSLDRKA